MKLSLSTSLSDFAQIETTGVDANAGPEQVTVNLTAWLIPHVSRSGRTHAVNCAISSRLKVDVVRRGLVHLEGEDVGSGVVSDPVEIEVSASDVS